jgi:HEAT repeat protein
MTRRASGQGTARHVAAFVDHNEKRMDAVKALDVRAANRHFPSAAHFAESLSERPDGRRAMEQLLLHPVMHVRLSAAEHVLKWNPSGAIARLGQLIHADLSAVTSPDERLDIRDRAKSALYSHFNIRSFNRNDLVEPLKAFGVDLPYTDHAAWR